MSHDLTNCHTWQEVTLTFQQTLYFSYCAHSELHRSKCHALCNFQNFEELIETDEQKNMTASLSVCNYLGAR